MLSEPSCARLCDLIGIEDNIGLNMLVCSTMRFVGILVFICFLVAFPSLKSDIPRLWILVNPFIGM